MKYPSIPGTKALPYNAAPPIQESSLPPILTSPPPPKVNSKSIFAFWHTGIHTLHPVSLRNVIAWYRRLSPLGWTIYVFDTVPDSPLNISKYLDIASPDVVPDAFRNNSLEGEFKGQHTSDLVRFPLLLRYGGVYMDVGILLYGDLDALWTNHITNPASLIDFAGFTLGEFPNLSIVNFTLICAADNPLVKRAHYIFLRLWEGKNSTTGAHKHPLVSHVPLMQVPPELVTNDEGAGKMVINDESMTDYAVQIQCLGAAERWVDESDGWNGPQYVKDKCWLFSMMAHSYAHEQLTNWDGTRQQRLLSLKLPEPGEEETEDQKLARSMVEVVVGNSWCLKLGHGFSAKLFGGDTLGIRWRKEPGSDCVEGTYAGWLRWAEVNLAQDKLLDKIYIGDYEPTMRGSLLGRS